MGLPSEVNSLMMGSSGYQISRSVRLRSAATAYFERTLGSGNRKLWTFSTWLKTGTVSVTRTIFGAGVYTGSPPNLQNYVFINANGQIDFNLFTGSVFELQLVTTPVFRDPSAWYHVVFVYDSAQATAANRAKIYVNGVQITSFATATYPAQNTDGYVNSSLYPHRIGRKTDGDGATSYWDGYLAETYFVDGQALTPSSFGATDTVTGVWNPIPYTGTYDTNGFKLTYADNSGATATTIGKDYSGNANNFTPFNVSVTAGTTYDSMTDVPTNYGDGGNGRGNYCVLNPNDRNTSTTVSNGNLSITGGSNLPIRSTFFVSSGKWYWEAVPTVYSSAVIVGIANASASLTNYIGVDANGYGYASTGARYNSGSGVAYGSTWGLNDVIGVAFDADAGTLTFYKNNVSQGTAYTGISGLFSPAFSTGTSTTVAFNFGQRPFSYTPPTGYNALNTQNLPEPSVANGATYFSPALYTGTGSTLTVAHGLTFNPNQSPNMVWLKSQSAVADHGIFDTARGPWSRALYPNTNGAEVTTAGVGSANRTNITIGGDGAFNTNAASYVAWSWRSGAVPGFDIVTYTGTGVNRTVAHALGAIPKFMVVKRRNSTGNWVTYTSVTGAGNYILLNATNISTADATVWNNTAPTSSVFSLGTSVDVNTNGGTYVAYLWSEVPGFSRIGSYTGNGNADGPFVWCGFRPRFVIFKNITSANNWQIDDAKRDEFNLVDLALFPNLTNVETVSANNSQDFLANGFKVRGSGTATNGNTNTIAFMAFAENPFKIARAR